MQVRFSSAMPATAIRRQSSANFSGVRKPQQVQFGDAAEVASSLLLSLAAAGALVTVAFAAAFGGSPVKRKDRRNANNLIKYIEQGNNKKAEKLLEQGLSPRSVAVGGTRMTGTEYKYPFLTAMRCKNFEIAQAMIDKYKFNLETPVVKQFGIHTLMDELLVTNAEAVAFALKNGLSPDTPSKLRWSYGQSPVEMIAVAFQYENDETIGMLKTLLDYGAQADLQALLEGAKGSDPYYDLKASGIEIDGAQPKKPRTVALLQERLAAGQAEN